MSKAGMTIGIADPYRTAHLAWAPPSRAMALALEGLDGSPPAVDRGRLAGTVGRGHPLATGTRWGGSCFPNDESVGRRGSADQSHGRNSPKSFVSPGSPANCMRIFLDTPMDLTAGRAEPIVALASLPAVLAAAEVMELSKCDEATIQLAVENSGNWQFLPWIA